MFFTSLYRQFYRTAVIILLGLSGFLATAQETSVSEPCLLSVAIDLSGSMDEERESANRGILALFAVLDSWLSKYPEKLGDFHLQVIGFGARGERFPIIPVTRVSRTKLPELAERIRTYRDRGRGTDYAGGLAGVLTDADRRFDRHQTIFLTDGEDRGGGPETGVTYERLGAVSFVIFGDKSVGNWLDVLPYATQTNVTASAPLTTLFVQVLFAFLTDADRYLIRRGTRLPDERGQFPLHKHALDVAQQIMLIGERTEVEVLQLLDPDGVTVPPTRYQLRGNHPGFVELHLDADLPGGDYRLRTDNAGEIAYISFERCAIELRASSGEDCFTENAESVVEFNFHDADRGWGIEYPDFLAHVNYRYELPYAQLTNRDGYPENGLYLSHRFPSGGKNAYEVRTGWSYRLGNIPSVAPKRTHVDTLCVVPDGRLIELRYDTAQTWEGRRLRYEARVENWTEAFRRSYPELKLFDGRDTVRLYLEDGKRGVYGGNSRLLLPQVYRLEWVAANNDFRLAFSGDPAYFEVRPRNFEYRIVALQENPDDSRSIEFDVLNQDEDVSVGLPYTDAYRNKWTVSLRANKVFSDESAVLSIKTLETNPPPGLSIQISPVGSRDSDERLEVVEVVIDKTEGDLELKESVSPVPGLSVGGWIEVRAVGPSARVPLQDRAITFSVRTDVTDRRWTAVGRGIKWGGVVIALAAVLALLAALWYGRRIRTHGKRRTWFDQIRTRSPEDFLSHFDPPALRYLDQGIDQPTPLTRRRVLKELIRSDGTGNRTYELVRLLRTETLNKLSRLVRQPNIDDVNWEFPITPGTETTVRVISNGADEVADREESIRVRCSHDAHYGTFRMRGEQLYFENPTSVVHLIGRDGRPERIRPGGDRELASRETLLFGPDAERSYFVAVVAYDQIRLSVTILPRLT